MNLNPLYTDNYNPFNLPPGWKAAADSPRPDGSHAVVYITPQGKAYTINSVTMALQKGAHGGLKK